LQIRIAAAHRRRGHPMQPLFPGATVSPPIDAHRVCLDGESTVRIVSKLAAPLVAVLLFTTAAAAQNLAPALVIASPGERPVALRAVAVRTEISGSLALTSVELTFFNPNRRQLEGELQFPLQDGQNVVGMAMDIDGHLRDAVPVDKARGQAVFEDVTRARIDPALLSVTQGNNYKLRVYPILPQRDKVVVLRYMETLSARGGKQLYGCRCTTRSGCRSFRWPSA
jgi:hypothetical protein